MPAKLKEKKCRLKTCRELFQPVVDFQKYCSPSCRFTEANRKRAQLVKRAQRIIDAQEAGA